MLLVNRMVKFKCVIIKSIFHKSIYSFMDDCDIIVYAVACSKIYFYGISLCISFGALTLLVGDRQCICPIRNLCHLSPKVHFQNKWRMETKEAH